MSAVYERILLTGAAGQLGRVLRPFLAQRCRHLRSSDRLAAPDDLYANEQWQVCNLADLQSCQALLEDVDVVVHMGGQSIEADWDVVHECNIVGAYNLWESARDSGVQRILFASSNHAVGFYERDDYLDERCTVRPDSLYGVSKVFGEGLGRYYSDKYSIAAFCMRIGSCYPEPTNRRMLSTWLSYTDLRQLIEVGLEADYRFEIVYGVSANKRAWWDNANAKRLGYTPQDDAEQWAQTLDAVEFDDPVARRFQGGEFAAMDYRSEPR